MKVKLFCLGLLIFFISCKSVNKNNYAPCDSIFVYDTVRIIDTTEQEQIITVNCNTPPTAYKKFERYKQMFFRVVSENNIDSAFSEKFNKKILPEQLIYCLLFDDKMVNETVILFFLKYHYSILQKKNGCSSLINNEVNYGKNKTYMALLFYQYSKITGTTGLLYSDDVFFWVMSNEEYLSNPEIKQIFNLIEKNPIHKRNIESIKIGANKGDSCSIKYYEILKNYYKKY